MALLAGVEHLRARDARLRALLDAHPCSFDRLATPARGTAFSQLARTIVGQQLHDTAAKAIHVRLCAACAVAEGSDLTPAALIAAPDAALLAAGLSRAKLRALRDLAGRFADARLSEELIAGLNDEELMRALTEVVGIGEWTVRLAPVRAAPVFPCWSGLAYCPLATSAPAALISSPPRPPILCVQCHMFLIFSLKRLDVLPTGDLAVRKGFQALYCSPHAQPPPLPPPQEEQQQLQEEQKPAPTPPAALGKAPGRGRARAKDSLPTHAQMVAIAECWRPYRSLGAYLMWHLMGTRAPLPSVLPLLPCALVVPPPPSVPALPTAAGKALPAALCGDLPTPATPARAPRLVASSECAAPRKARAASGTAHGRRESAAEDMTPLSPAARSVGARSAAARLGLRAVGRASATPQRAAERVHQAGGEGDGGQSEPEEKALKVGPSRGAKRRLLAR